MTEEKVFIANRGEIAVRIIRAAKDMSIPSVLGHSEADTTSLAARLADQTICVGPAAAMGSYLNVTAMVSAAVAMGCTLIHPGFGFLSENAEFAEACEDNGLHFLGPRPHTIREMGDKIAAKRLAESLGVPTLASITVDEDFDPRAVADANLRYPLLAKAAAGGGGRGMRVIMHQDELIDRLKGASAEALAAFSDGRVFVERYIPAARHVEVQVFGWGDGSVVALGDRDCSTQRRHQKLIEECPAPNIPPEVRAALHASAVKLAAAVDYRSAGTVEFILDPTDHGFYFLEMNTRLQVEHPVTEETHGVDLAAMQLRLGLGDLDPADVRFADEPRRHSIECRVTAEDPQQDFRPTPGRLDVLSWPGGPGVRIDSGVRAGDEITPFYDSMFAKIIVTAADRPTAITRMRRALAELEIEGVAVNTDFLSFVLSTPEFIACEHDTTWVESMALPAYLGGART